MEQQREMALSEQRERVKNLAHRQIWVTFQKEGIHKYPSAAHEPHLVTGDEYDVSFLCYPHRHIFHFRVSIDVFHNDRDIEFIQFKRWCESLYAGNGSVLDLNYKSCEMMADDLYDQIALRYPQRNVIIEVSEDGENGCTIKYNTSHPNLTVKI